MIVIFEGQILAGTEQLHFFLKLIKASAALQILNNFKAEL